MENEKERAAFLRFMKTGRIEDYLAYTKERKDWPPKP